MIIDRLENLEKYASLNPLFARAIEFLKSNDLLRSNVSLDLARLLLNVQLDAC